MSFKSKWKYGLKGARSVAQRCPIVVEKTVLVTFAHGQGSNFQGTLSAVDVDSGEELWRFNAEHYLNEPCISVYGDIFTTCFDGTVYKLGIDGQLQWKSQPSECNLGPSTFCEDKFYYAEIGGRSKYTRALNTKDGSVAWEYENGGHSYALATDYKERIVHCSVSGGIDEKTIYLHCLNKDTGKILWKTKHDEYLFEPLILDGFIYIGSRSHVSLFSLASGELLATHQIEDGVAVTARPIATDSGVVFITEEGQVFCLSTLETKVGIVSQKLYELDQLWSLELPCEIKARILQDGSLLLAIVESGNLVTIDARNGEILNQEKLSGFKEGHGMASYESDFIVSVSKDCVRLARNI
jgi:outer membrane protein assembly factor BamB